MTTTSKRYRVDGANEYAIDYRQQSNGTFKIVATDCPSDSHGKGPETHHRYASGEICVAEGREPKSLDRAKAIAMAWIDGYEEYLATAQFPTGKRRIKV